tara:strand:+ start:23210 stop:24514 length:1305 start_codon:yes stop_codon:yes gene_type:complete
MSKKLKKYILFLLILTIFSSISYSIGVYSYYYKIFPFNTSSKIEAKKTRISSAFYDFDMKTFNLPYSGKYGGIDLLNDQILFISGNGEGFYLDEKNLKFKEVDKFDLNINKKKFIKKYEKDFGKLKLRRRFGIKDIHINEFDNQKLLFFSSLYYNSDKDCYNLSLFRSKIINEKNYKFNKPIKVFETKKCLIIENNLPSSTTYKLGRNFAPTSASGRIEKIDNNHILLTVGDFLYDGVNSEDLVQDLNSDYGKILKINILDFSHEIFSIGHRNPQGLVVIDKDNIFSSEHGPYGGDEINKIEKNKNYGWPYYTYGTDYGKKSWPLNNKLKLDNYKEPIVSWTPSIAVSNLIFYNSKYLPKWKNNFIVSTLRDKNLYRITLSKNYRRMINVEKIKIGYRMRDIIVDSRGRIIILTDTKNNDVAPKIIILENKKVN